MKKHKKIIKRYEDTGKTKLKAMMPGMWTGELPRRGLGGRAKAPLTAARPSLDSLVSAASGRPRARPPVATDNEQRYVIFTLPTVCLKTAD